MNGGLWHGNPVRAYARALDIGTKAAAHNMLAHVARANAELENATRGLKAQLGPELDAAPEARKTDCSHRPVGDSTLCSTFESAPEFPEPAKDALVGS